MVFFGRGLRDATQRKIAKRGRGFGHKKKEARTSESHPQ